MHRQRTILCLAAMMFFPALSVGASLKSVQIFTTADPKPQVSYGIDKLKAALMQQKQDVCVVNTLSQKPSGHSIRIGLASDGQLFERLLSDKPSQAEAFAVSGSSKEGYIVAGADPAGVMYGCLELANHVQQEGTLPESMTLQESPSMSLRGTCVFLMKLGLYDYPVTPEEFPFFYDKALWIDYLDFLAENRFNYIAFWNGHPFDYFVELPNYPEAQDGMSKELLRQNHDMLMWLSKEAGKRNIWLMFQFYQIHTSVYFAEAHGLDPHGSSTPTPLLTDYTMHCIERFVSEFPGIGLYICAGERLRLPYVADWVNDVIFAAVKKTGKNPPIMLRSWVIDLPNARKVADHYSPLYTERKFNVEHIASTEIDPENRDWAQVTGDHVVNVHIMGNLEPFRWSPPSFIQKCVQNSLEDGGATGLHLYPRKVWRWPDNADINGAFDVQWHRDWMWFETWARYAWNPERDPQSEKEFWITRLTDKYGNKDAAKHILSAYEHTADVLPAIQRLFWIGNSGHTVAASGVTMQQIINAKGVPFLKLPEMIRMPDYIAALKKGEPVEGTPPVELLKEKVAEATTAYEHAKQAVEQAAKNHIDVAQIASDAKAVLLIAEFYLHKIKAAVAYTLLMDGIEVEKNTDIFEKEFTASIKTYRDLTELTVQTYDSISDCPMWHPYNFGSKICPYHWSDVLPRFEKEYDAGMGNLKFIRENPESLSQEIKPFPPVEVTGLTAEQDTYTVKPDSKIFTDRDYTFGKNVPAEFVGLASIRFSNDLAKTAVCPVAFSVKEPVKVFVAFNDKEAVWADPPKGWNFYAGGYEVGHTRCDIYWKDFPAGKSTLQFDKGTFVIMGFTQQNIDLPKVRIRLTMDNFFERKY